jgi:class 3 adenylate cyclase
MQLLVVSPESRPSRSFPLLALYAFAGALAVGIALDFWGVHAPLPFVFTGLAAIVAACSLATWTEDFFSRLAGHDVRQRLFAGALIPSAAVLLARLTFAVIDVLPVALPGKTTAACAVLSGFFWLASTAWGSLCVLVIDLAVRVAVADFRTRITVTLFAVLALVFAFAYNLTGAATTVLRPAFEMAFGPVSARIFAESLANPAEAHGLRQLLLLAPIVFLGVPALLSACAKLADTVTERLYPLAKGFELVSKGKLNVRVEEQGSRDFVAISRAFNEMAYALAVSRGIERAFGVYLGQPLLERIREQHGEAMLPASARQATVFFADIRGFTAMSERLKPDEVLSVLNRYFGRVIQVIDGHHGYLDKFVGDAVVVVFNFPVDQEDHAARGARCALALQAEVALMNSQGFFPEIGELRIGVGVATGPLVAGNVGGAKHLQYTVVGDTVNLAARLTSHVPPGEVWVNEANAAALPREIDCTPLASIRVKGKERPVVPHCIRETARAEVKPTIEAKTGS